MKLLNILLTCWLLLAGNLVYAVAEVELNNAEDDPRFNELANVLRCMVCQNQTIADSNADLAKDFRNQVKEKINAGQSNDEIIDYMVARYGDYILYRPPFNVATALLWIGPFLLVIGGLLMVFKLARKRDAVSADDAASIKDKQARLKEMLSDDSESES